MAAGTDTSFKVRNTLVVNTGFSVNSTGIYFGGVLTVNSSTFVGTANNALNLNGVAPSSYVNTSANFTIAGNITHSGNVIFSGVGAGLVANGNLGSQYQLLISNGTTPYWGVINAANVSGLVASATTDTTNASNITTGTLTLGNVTHSSSTLTVGNSTVNSVVGATSIAVGNSTSNHFANSTAIVIGTSAVNATMNSTTFSGTSLTANNATNLGGTAAAGYQTAAGLSANVAGLGYQTTAGLSANVATLAANAATYLNGQLAAYYTNATNISTGTLNNARLSGVLLTATADQTVSGGVTVTSNNLGTKSSGTVTIDCGTCPLQYLNNNGAFTLAAPSNDGSCVLLMTNGTGAGAVANSGFSVGTNVGDTLDTTSGHKFLWYILRVNGASTFTIKALQ